MAFLRLFAGYGGDKQRLIKWADGQAVGDGLSMSIGLGVGNDTRMTCGKYFGCVKSRIASCMYD